MEYESAIGETGRIQRAILLVAGEQARELAQAMLALGERCLGVLPPLQILDLGDGRRPIQGLHADEVLTTGDGRGPSGLEQLASNVDALANKEMLDRLRRAGWVPARPDEIQIWILLDLKTLPEPAAGAAADPLAVVRTLQALARARLRINAVPHALLLAEPTAYASLVRWAGHLSEVTLEALYVAGPVNHAHVLQADDCWAEHVSAALAGLLWGVSAQQRLEAAPAASPARATPEPGGQWAAGRAWAVGGMLLLPAVVELQSALATRWAARVAARLAGLRGETETRSKVAVDVDMAPISPAGHLRTVQAAVSPPRPGRPWRDRPGWPALTGLAGAVRAEAEAEAKRCRTAAYQVRQNWLTEQVLAWETSLTELAKCYLAPPDGWPQLVSYLAQLAALRGALQEVMEEIETGLEEAGRRYAAAETGLAQATAKLETLCRRYPPATWAGAQVILSHPWRWPRWAWDYWVTLPRLAQRLTDALAAVAQAIWEEANTHLVRQFYLGMAQAVRQRQTTTDNLLSLLEETAGCLAEAVSAMDWSRLAPWTEARCREFLRRLPLERAPDTGWLVDGLISADAMEAVMRADRLGPAAAFQSEPRWLADWLCDWAMNELTPMGGWTAADYVAAALDSMAFGSWLDSFMGAALPRWPGQELAVDVQVARWLWAPPPGGEAGEPFATDAAGQVAAWAARTRNVRLATGNLNALLAFQRCPIDLDLEREEGLHEPAELAQPDPAHLGG